MFQDKFWTKIKLLILPVFIWLAAGAVSEIVGSFVLYIIRFSGNAPELSGLLFPEMIAEAHERWEVWIVIGRNALALPGMFLLIRRDRRTILATLPLCRKRPEREAFLSERVTLLQADPLSLLLAALMGILFSLSVNLLFIQYLGGISGGADAVSQTALTPAGVIGIVLSELIFGPLTEELMVRGVLYKRMRTYMKVLPAMILQALIFAMLHGTALAMIYAFLLALLLSEVYENTYCIAAAAVLHVCANLAAVLVNLIAPLREFLLGSRPAPFIAMILLLSALFLFAARTRTIRLKAAEREMNGK